MKDRFGRDLEDLRITLTHTCNFSCFFCHMEGEGNEYLSGLPLDDIILVAKASKDFGIKYIKLTGGEPTLRRDITDIIASLKSLGFEISMTTNGILLSRLAVKLKESGLSRVNVSLHALDRETFKKITGVDALDKVLEGIKTAIDVNLRPVKLNFVVNKMNINEVKEIIDFSERIGIDELHLIEMHPVGLGKSTFSYHENLSIIEDYLKKISTKVTIRNKHFRPRYYLNSGLVVEVIKPYANPIFCAGCNRIRLTVDGKLKTCLYREDKVIDISGILKSKLSKDEKLELVKEAFKLAIAIREPNFKYTL
ncbi:GTP 3',8-cyclase MoaA [Acidianus sp. HS-5]|uniref:GTP 3',8-cyclase MoaA n=1 Tax=Acidianus sp. HS-5 TaxID=2886040 RepID=UPI001F27E171|nr:GTP 3',8-cyclase MoaA [Acidianus sp. HS-5]BDC19788.1 GTP 3',8-cyclase MoaA [Acidianus sp. HS-5]